MEFQTRRVSGELKFFTSLKDAMNDAKDKEVWKVSFDLPTGERVRMVRQSDGNFVYEPLMVD